MKLESEGSEVIGTILFLLYLIPSLVCLFLDAAAVSQSDIVPLVASGGVVVSVEHMDFTMKSFLKT